MTEISALPISKVGGATSTDDGKFVLLKLWQLDGSELILAIPSEQLLNLVDVAANGRVQSRKLQGIDPAAREAHTASWWELGVDTAQGQTMLSLTFGLGGRMDFLLPAPMPEKILETLELMLGRSAPLSPGTAVN